MWGGYLDFTKTSGAVHPLFTCAGRRPVTARWHDAPVSDLDWSTPDGLAAIRDHLAGAIDGWRAPVAHAVVLATVLGHDGSTATLPVSRHQLAAAVESLEPARACTDVDHPNLAAWQEVLLELDGNPAREAQAVFVADLDDPVTSEVDGSMRATFEGHTPEL